VDYRTDVATAEITYGGRIRERTEKELTAFPIRAPRGTLPLPEAMDGWFLADGAPLRVVAVEWGEPSIVFVLDADGPYEFRQMREKWLLPDATGTLRGTVRTLLAYPQARAGPRTFYEIFPGSFPRFRGAGLLAILASVDVHRDGQPCPRTADAAAVAGLAAAEHSHPRAVVLVLTGNRDASLRTARDIRAFLSDLGVPLVVWATGPAAPDAAVDWGESRSVRTRAAFREAVNSLEASLDEQRIVWVEGTHLPQSIFASPKAAAALALVR